MIGDAFVFDAVTHLYNMDASNVKNSGGELFNNHLYGFHAALTPPGEKVLSQDEFLLNWDIDRIANVVFSESDTDMLVAQPLPLTDFFHDGLSDWERCAEMARRYPDRVITWGTVNPLEGGKALDLMELQVKEFGVKAFKFYNIRYDFGSPFPWRMDDPRVAFPVYEKARELGINLIAVHKGVPLGPQPTEGTQVFDIDQAAASFPDLNFVIFHPGLPFIDEICWQIVRFPNIYVSLAATLNFIGKAPRWFAEVLGKLLFWGGPDKIVSGSEVPLWHPQWALKAFWEFQMPQDLTDGYGYPQLTTEIKQKILGGNLARLHGMDIDTIQQKISNDEFAKRRANGLAEPWSSR
jgi:predicted TIM-barrel fold metal-dependent hydrolase